MESKPQVVERPFCWSVKGLVKILRMVVTVASMTFFIIAQAPEPYIVITGFESTVVFFFIALYICRLDKMMRWLFWPLLVSDQKFFPAIGRHCNQLFGSLKSLR
ncbi:Cklf [Phodopus roborovskii]|uniref:Cklf protein n=1 Tax=Phodopus roborovskii TaxID=109678 RepID=A0AAV0A2W8_PHORO|nr:Cklf [Phodopus roborovskii]